MTASRSAARTAFKPSKWYRDDLAKSKAADTRARTADHATATTNNDRRAVDYALFLMQRDGVDLSVLIGAAIRKHNAQFPVKTHKLRGHTFTTQTGNTLAPEATPETRVLYERTEAGLRARKVVWRFRYPEVRVFELELPHWNYIAPDVTVEHDELLAA